MEIIRKNKDISPETFATVVIGTGPALLFSLINRIRLDQRNILLVSKIVKTMYFSAFRFSF